MIERNKMMKVKVAAAQLEFAFAATPQEFADRVRAPIERAAREGAQLIVLPNYLSYGLFGMFVPDLAAGARLEQIARAGEGATGTGGPVESVPQLMRERGRFVYEFYVHVFQSLAERTETWLVPGTAPEVSDGKWFNTALLFAPDGKTFGRQRQLHRSSLEREWGMSVGDEPIVISTEVGRLGLVIGEDLKYPEVSQVLASQGANVLVHPAAARVDTEEQLLADPRHAAQSNRVFMVLANLIGEGFASCSAVYAPEEFTSDHSGIVARASGESKEELVTAELDLDALRRDVDGEGLVTRSVV